MPESPPPEPAIFTILSTFLNTTSSLSAALELDILPSSFPLRELSAPILIDGPSLAIRKKDLVPPFLYARKILLSHIPDTRSAAEDSLDSLDSTGAELKRAFNATSAILFFDPEHLTAANFRKRYLSRIAGRCGYSPPDGDAGNASVRGVKRRAEPEDPALTHLRDEAKRDLHLVTSLTISPLKRHSKSPTLWHHRYWLMEKFRELFYYPSSHSCQANEAKGAHELWRSEHEVALRAADRHFANYYAFNYLRKLAELIGADVIRDGLGREIVNTVQKWCFAHPRDISGWAYLAFLLERGRAGRRRDGEEVREGDGNGEEVVNAVREWREKYGDWGRGTSVEWFLRALALTSHDNLIEATNQSEIQS